MIGEYGDALKVLKTGIRRESNNFHIHLNLAATYTRLGRDKEARMETEEILRVNPVFSLKQHEKSLPWKNQAAVKDYIDALRKAGLK